MGKDKLWTKNFILLIIVSLCAGFMVSFYINTLPVHVEAMTGTAVYAGLVTTVYTIAALVIRPVVGVLCESVSSAKLMVAGLLLMAASCFAYSFTSAIGMLLVIRAIHGVGFGIKSTASGVLAAEVIPKSRFAEGIGMFGLYLPVTNAIGPAIGLTIMEDGDINWLFFLGAIMGAFSLLLMLFVRTEHHTKTTAKASKKEEDAQEVSILPKTVLGFEFGAVFPAVTLALTYFGYSAIMSFAALYGKSVGMNGMGLFFTIGAIALFISRFIFAKLVKKYGYHKFVIGSNLLLTVTLFIIPHTTSIGVMYLLAIFYGCAVGVVPMAVNAQVLERCSIRRRGTAMAAYTSAMDIGIGVGSLVIGVIVEGLGFHIAFAAAAISCLASALLYGLTVARDHDRYLKRMEKINLALTK